jgi:ribosomal subunit interface protein
MISSDGSNSYDSGEAMKIVLHARNAQLAEDFSEIAFEKLRTLARFNVAIEGMKVEVKHESNPHHGKNSHIVTLTSHGAGPFLRAQGESFNDLSAFDEAVESLELQIRKIHERSKDVPHESVITHLAKD